MAPNFDQLATALRQIFFVDGRNLDDPQLLAELGWIHDAIGRGQGPRPPQALIQKTVQTRKTSARGVAHDGLIGVGAASLRSSQMLKAFQGSSIQCRPLGCWIVRDGQPLLLVPCCS